jgi:hypothetical protein
MEFGGPYALSVIKPIALSDLNVELPQLKAPAPGGAIASADLLVDAKFDASDQLAMSPRPASDIFQPTGSGAVADVPIPLKFSVTMVLAGILICESAIKVVTKKTVKRKPVFISYVR